MDDGDDIVVMIVPDYQMLEYVERIASRLSDDPVFLNLFIFFSPTILLSLLVLELPDCPNHDGLIDQHVLFIVESIRDSNTRCIFINLDF